MVEIIRKSDKIYAIYEFLKINTSFLKSAAIFDFGGHFEYFLVIFQLGTISYLILHIKIPLYAKFPNFYIKTTAPNLK